MRMYKNIVIVVLGATFAALTFATPALAGWGSGFVSWADVAGTTENGSATSPHGGYSTTTIKCAVCHAVHNASSSGQVLLRSSVAEACTYCHIDLMGSAETTVYEGIMTNYTVETEYGHQSYDSGAQGVKCSQCHQVHAAEQFMTARAELRTKILIGAKTQDLLDPYYDPRIETAPGPGDPSKDVALTKWCTRCHKPGETDEKYSYYSLYYSDVTHVMKTPGAYAGDGDGATGLTVAWASSENCASCHSKGYKTSQWPHWSPSKRFLVSGESSSAASKDITGTTSTSTDGVCLRCHRDGTNGVGSSY